MTRNDTPTPGRSGRRARRRTALLVAPAAAAMVAATASPALADQPKGGPYAPVSADGGQTIEAWADMTGDCPTARCDTYFKVERLESRSWLFGDTWQDVTGGWISRQEGWVAVSGGLAEGCATYRSVVLDYVLEHADDAAVEVGNGQVGVTIPVDGGMVYQEYIYPSAETTLCGERLANHPTY